MASYKQLIAGVNVRPKVGFFGYSSITLIQDGSENILFDLGGPGVRDYLIKLRSEVDITKVFISHLHFDHCANLDLFTDCPVLLHELELTKIIEEQSKTGGLVKMVINNYLSNNKFNLFSKSFNLSDNVTCVMTPGHTIGHSSLSLTNDNKDRVLVAGDAIETLTEYLENEISVSYYNLDHYTQSKKYIKDNFDIIIPGHYPIISRNDLQPQPPYLTEF